MQNFKKNKQILYPELIEMFNYYKENLNFYFILYLNRFWSKIQFESIVISNLW